MPGVCYLGDAAGARVLATTDALPVPGDPNSAPYALDVATWDLVPAGEVGDVLFRSIDVAFHCANGFAIGVTPILDGVALAEQAFTGFGTGERQVQAFFAGRGTRIAARIRTLALPGDLELHNVGATFCVLRATP